VVGLRFVGYVLEGGFELSHVVDQAENVCTVMISGQVGWA